jgi:hypothetical protein
MAKKQSKVKPFISRVDPESLTRKELQSITKSKNIHQYDYTDSDVETPFGVVKMRECDILDLEYGDSVPLLFNFDEISEAFESEDWLESVVLLEKAIEKHPKTLIFYFQLAESYTALKRYDKTVSTIEMNYSLHKGLPLVDIPYMELGSEIDDEEDNNDYFLLYNERQYNIHNAYAERKYFHPSEIVEYYCHLGETALHKKDMFVAEQCLAIALSVEPQSQRCYLLEMLITEHKNPNKKKLKLLFGFGVLLSIIGLIIWGIYRLLAWIF